MDHLTFEMIAFLLGAGFLAAFIDSCVGGGGLVSVPALMLTGLPLPVVLGTNKLAACMSVTVSSWSFFRSGNIRGRLVAVLFPLSFVGSVLGAMAVKHVPTWFLRPLVIVLLAAVLAYTLLKKEWGSISTYKGLSRNAAMASVATAFGIGLYDGFFGPGTGSFLIFAFLMMGFDFVTAAGNAKVLNLASNLAAVVAFALMHSIDYRYGLVMGGGMIAGALVGSRLAITKGVAYVRPLFIGVTVVMIGKLVWDLLK